MPTVFGDQNVRRFDIAVDDALGVSIVESFGELFG